MNKKEKKLKELRNLRDNLRRNQAKHRGNHQEISWILEELDKQIEKLENNEV